MQKLKATDLRVEQKGVLDRPLVALTKTGEIYWVGFCPVTNQWLLNLGIRKTEVITPKETSSKYMLSLAVIPPN